MGAVAPLIGVGASVWGPGAACAGAAAPRPLWPEAPGDAFWAPAVPGARTARVDKTASETAKRFGIMTSSFRPRPSTRDRVLLEPHVLDLVEERSIADLQHLGGLDAIPPALLQRASDDLPLGLQHRAPGDLLERQALRRGEGLPAVRRGCGDGGDRRQRMRKRQVLEHE